MHDRPWVHSGTPRRRGQALVTQLEASWCRRCAGHQELLSVREDRPWSWLSRVCTGDSGQVRGTAEEAQGAPRGRRQAFCGVSCASSRRRGWTGEACLRLGAGRLGAPWSLRVSVRGRGGAGGARAARGQTSRASRCVCASGRPGIRDLGERPEHRARAWQELRPHGGEVRTWGAAAPRAEAAVWTRRS